MALGNNIATILLDDECAKTVVALQTLQAVRSVAEGIKNPVFGPPQRFPKQLRNWFHNDQKGILLDHDSPYYGGSLLLKYQQVEDEDYTHIDRVFLDGTTFIAGRNDLEQIFLDNDKTFFVGHNRSVSFKKKPDLIYSGQKKSGSHSKPPGNNIKLAMSKKPFLVIVQTKTEIILLGYYVVKKVRRIKNSVFTHVFGMDRLENDEESTDPFTEDSVKKWLKQQITIDQAETVKFITTLYRTFVEPGMTSKPQKVAIHKN